MHLTALLYSMLLLSLSMAFSIDSFTVRQEAPVWERSLRTAFSSSAPYHRHSHHQRHSENNANRNDYIVWNRKPLKKTSAADEVDVTTAITINNRDLFDISKCAAGLIFVRGNCRKAV